MNIHRAGKQTKAFWRVEQKAAERWQKEPEPTFALNRYQITQERIQGLAIGWIAGIAWARRQSKAKKSK